MFMCRNNYFIKNEEYINRRNNGLNMTEFIIQQPPTVNVRNLVFTHNPVFNERYNNLHLLRLIYVLIKSTLAFRIQSFVW